MMNMNSKRNGFDAVKWFAIIGYLVFAGTAVTLIAIAIYNAIN